MTERTMKVPGPDHPITLAPHKGVVIVRVAGLVVAESRDAIRLQEAAYPPVFYIPRRDISAMALERSDHESYCPYKGEASYFNLPVGGARADNAAWSYEAPYPAVEAIRGHVAFYPDRVGQIEIRDADADA